MTRPRIHTQPTSRPCGHWIGVERRYCGAIENVLRYMNSWACPAHSPAALKEARNAH